MQKSPTRRSSARSPAGFSLIEMVISLSLLSVLLTSVFQLVWQVEKSYAHEKRVAEMQQNQRYGLELIARALKTAGNNPEGIALNKIDLDPDGNSLRNSIRIQSDFNPPDGDVQDSSEDVQFRVANNCLMYRNGPPGSLEVAVLGNVQSISFTAQDDVGSQTSDVNLMSTVTVTVNATTERKSLQTGTVRTQSLSATIQLRI